MNNSTFQHSNQPVYIHQKPLAPTDVFKLLEVKQGETKTITYSDSSYILCCKTGTVNITCPKYGSHHCQNHQMILAPRGILLHITGLSLKSNMLVISCVEFSRTQDRKLHLYKYIDIKETTTHLFGPIPIKNALWTCVESIALYLKQGVASEKLFNLKLDEVAACIEHNYSPQEITQLFYPIIARDSSFQNFIISNYSHRCNVAELINKSNLCKTIFYEKFKEEFGMTAKQWMLKQKMKLIEYMIDDQSMRIKDIIIDCGFSSHVQFYNFCQRHFNCTPTELKMRLRR